MEGQASRIFPCRKRRFGDKGGRVTVSQPGVPADEPQQGFDLVEAMRFDPLDGIADIERHLGRMKSSAEELGFLFDRHGARNELQAATFHLREPRQVRLLLAPSGALSIEVRPLPRLPAEPVEVAVTALPVLGEDLCRQHSTSDRSRYEAARQAAGTFEILFEDEAGFLTEGSFTNLFVPREGTLVTPPLSRGLLPDPLRERLIDSGETVEGDVIAADLVGGFFVGNAVMGLAPAKLSPVRASVTAGSS